MTKTLLGYGYTNAQGVATLDYDPNDDPIEPSGYHGTGAGHIGITAETAIDGNILQETFSIQDYIFYDFDTLTETKTYNQNIGSTSFAIECDLIATATNSLAYITVGQNSNNMYYIGMMYQSNNQGVMVRVNGENTQYQAQTRIPLNTEAHIVFTYENGALTYSDGDETLTISDSNITPSTLLGLTIRSATVTNLKIYNI